MITYDYDHKQARPDNVEKDWLFNSGVDLHVTTEVVGETTVRVELPTTLGP